MQQQTGRNPQNVFHYGAQFWKIQLMPHESLLPRLDLKQNCFYNTPATLAFHCLDKQLILLADFYFYSSKTLTTTKICDKINTEQHLCDT